jgi:hypothetical protein
MKKVLALVVAAAMGIAAATTRANTFFMLKSSNWFPE